MDCPRGQKKVAGSGVSTVVLSTTFINSRIAYLQELPVQDSSPKAIVGTQRQFPPKYIENAF